MRPCEPCGATCGAFAVRGAAGLDFAASGVTPPLAPATRWCDANHSAGGTHVRQGTTDDIACHSQRDGGYGDASPAYAPSTKRPRPSRNAAVGLPVRTGQARPGLDCIAPPIPAYGTLRQPRAPERSESGSNSRVTMRKFLFFKFTVVLSSDFPTMQVEIF